MMKSGFISIHPLLSFSYFMAILILSMSIRQPLYLLGSLFITVGLLYFLDRWMSLRKHLKFYLLMAFIILILNPLFSTEGSTVLFYLKNRSVTLEGVQSGITFALSLLNILFMFLAYNLVITPRRFLYLFGNLIPKMSFILTIIMGFIPLFSRRMQEIIDFRRIQNATLYASKKQTLKQKLVESMTTLNTLVGWTLEESLQNATSMRARGYGTCTRTSATIYSFDKRDRCLLIIVAFLLLISLFASLSMHIAYDLVGLLLFTSLPLWIEMREHLRWHFMKSNI